MQISAQTLADIELYLRFNDYPDAYNAVLTDLQSQISDGDFTPSDDDNSILEFLNVAQQINSAETTRISLFIRINNEVASKLILGKDIDVFGPENQASSNTVAQAFFASVIANNGEIQSFSQIANIDATNGLISLGLGSDPEAWAGAYPPKLSIFQAFLGTDITANNYYSANLNASQQQESVLIHSIATAALAWYEINMQAGVSATVLQTSITQFIDSCVDQLNTGASLINNFDAIAAKVQSSVQSTTQYLSNILSDISNISSGPNPSAAATDISTQSQDLYGSNSQPDLSSQLQTEASALDYDVVNASTYDLGPGIDLVISDVLDPETDQTQIDPSLSIYDTNGTEDNSTLTTFDSDETIVLTDDTNGNISATSDIVELGASDISFEDPVLVGVTLEGFTEDPTLSFEDDGSLEIQNFDSDSLYGSGLSISAVAHLDDSLSILATGSMGTTQNVITYTPGQITGDRIANFNYAQATDGALEFNVLSSDGTQLVSDTVAVLNGGSVELTGGSWAEVIFSGNSGVLQIDTPFDPVGSILNFQAGDTIDLAGIQSEIDDLNGVSSPPPYSLDIVESGGFLNIDVLDVQMTETVEPGGGTIENATTWIYQSSSIDLSAYLGYEPSSVATASDGAGGVDVFTSDRNPLCFGVGTRIATPCGEVPVEQVAVGDEVVTASGQRQRIVWIGEGRVLATRGQRNAATPVIVRKGALADNVPHRDLRVTKAHALYIDAVLIPVEFLINHRSIIWDDHAQEVELYHIELATHDVLIANGAPAESYRDDGNRWLFRNANSGWGLPPQKPCAPVLTGGPLVDAIWRRLLARAGPRPGVPTTDDPDLHLLVDGRRVDAALRSGMLHMFRFVARPTMVRIVSRAATPAGLGLARDPRSLGVALRQIMVSHGMQVRTIEAEDPMLTEGFHGFEEDEGIRWTDGDAAVPVGLFDGFTGPLEIALRLGGKNMYVDEGVIQRVA